MHNAIDGLLHLPVLWCLNVFHGEMGQIKVASWTGAVWV